MNLTEKVNQALKEAMKARNDVAKRSIRAIKSAILLANTDGSGKDLNSESEIKLLQKLVKQRQDSYTIFTEQGRDDLAIIEKEEIEVIQQFLPKQVSEEDLKTIVAEIIGKTGASSMKDMGKVMGMASKELSGRADGKSISNMVKQLLG